MFLEAARHRAAGLQISTNLEFILGDAAQFEFQPETFDIIDGKLYFFVNADVYDAYKADAENILAVSHQKWPEIQHVAVGDL